jgi:hypothetical protein
MSLALANDGVVRYYVFVLVIVFSALASAGSAQAMWVRMTDADLVESSQLIVVATYTGRAEVTLEEDGKVIYRGVLDVDDTLKGDRQDVVYIMLSLPEGMPHKSDDVYFLAGQKGLWFLRKDSQHTGIYQIDNPQHFIPERAKSRIDSLIKLLAY